MHAGTCVQLQRSSRRGTRPHPWRGQPGIPVVITDVGRRSAGVAARLAFTCTSGPLLRSGSGCGTFQGGTTSLSSTSAAAGAGACPRFGERPLAAGACETMQACSDERARELPAQQGSCSAGAKRAAASQPGLLPRGLNAASGAGIGRQHETRAPQQERSALRCQLRSAGARQAMPAPQRWRQAGSPCWRAASK